MPRQTKSQEISMKILLISALLGMTLVGVSTRVSASSDGAWREFNTRVTRACISASGIRRFRASSIVAFDDRVGMVAMLVSDRTRGSSLSKLCLYDKRNKRAYIDEAEMWSAPPQSR